MSDKSSKCLDEAIESTGASNNHVEDDGVEFVISQDGSVDIDLGYISPANTDIAENLLAGLTKEMGADMVRIHRKSSLFTEGTVKPV